MNHVRGRYHPSFPANLALLASNIFKSDSIHDKIRFAVDDKASESVKFQHVVPSLFPYPHLTVGKLAISVPGTASGSIESTHIYPAMTIWSLRSKQ